jgi:ubiquinone/menaquinone biosynthesis C-methylase UbiE
MDLQQYRQTNLETWQTMVAGWQQRRDQMSDTAREVTDWLIAKLDPQPGQTILELAAGLGETGFEIAKTVGDGGRLISTDFAPAMVDAATHRATELGLNNTVCRVMDAERMDLPDDCVDGVVCRWGYMLMADPAAALIESRRVLKEGGRVAFSVWGAADSNPWAGVPARVLMQHGLAPRPESGAPGIFNMADPERIRYLMSDAGFGDPEIDEIRVSWRFNDFDDWWDFTVNAAGGLAMLIAVLSDEDRDAVREECREALEEYSENGGYALPGLCLNAVTT